MDNCGIEGGEGGGDAGGVPLGGVPRGDCTGDGKGVYSGEDPGDGKGLYSRDGGGLYSGEMSPDGAKALRGESSAPATPPAPKRNSEVARRCSAPSPNLRYMRPLPRRSGGPSGVGLRMRER